MCQVPKGLISARPSPMPALAAVTTAASIALAIPSRTTRASGKLTPSVHCTEMGFKAGLLGSRTAPPRGYTGSVALRRLGPFSEEPGDQPHSDAGGAGWAIRLLLFGRGRAGDIQVRPWKVAREVSEEGPAVDRPRPTPAGVVDVRRSE